jgi:hypothetical protein
MLRNTLNTFLTATLIMLLGVSSSASAQTIVPAGSKIISTSELTIGDKTLSGSVAVTVLLNRATPTLARIGSPESLQWISGETTLMTYTYTITTNANGPAKYTVSAEAASDFVTVGQIRVGESREPKEFSLGATAVSSVAADGVITVPSDGRFSGKDPSTTVNGIKANDTVSINGEVYTVTEVTDDNGETATITLDRDPGILPLGTPIAEQEEFTVTLREARLSEEAPSGRADVNLTVTASQQDFGEDATDNPSFLVIAPRDPEIKMYVRNTGDTGNPVATDDNSITYPGGGGATYFKTDLVNAIPGNTLEYLVVVTAGNVDPIQDTRYERPDNPSTEFLEYVPGSTRLNAGDPIPDESIEQGVLLIEDIESIPPAEFVDIDNTAYVTYQVKVIGGVGDWLTGGPNSECLHDADGLWAPDMNATKCKGVKWNAANGQQNADGGPMVEHNPVCWDTNKFGDGWQVGGDNPWVVGTAYEYNNEAYDCRTKCAGKSGESLKHCATDGWWVTDAAGATMCAWDGSAVARKITSQPYEAKAVWTIRSNICVK